MQYLAVLPSVVVIGSGQAAIVGLAPTERTALPVRVVHRGVGTVGPDRQPVVVTVRQRLRCCQREGLPARAGIGYLGGAAQSRFGRLLLSV